MAGKKKTVRLPIADVAAEELRTYQVEHSPRIKTRVFDASLAANSIADPDGAITEVNDMFLKVWGYPDRKEVIGKSISHFLNDPQEAAAILKTLNGTDRWEGTFVAEKRDGSTFIAQSLATIVRDENGELLGYQSAVVDITERKRVEDELKRSEAELRRQNNLFASFLKNLPLGVFMVEAPSGKPLLANETALKLLGRGILPDASRQNLAEVYEAYKADSGEPYPPEEMPILLGMSGKTTHVDDLLVKRPDGTEKLLEIFGSPVTDTQGHVWASLVSFFDITARRQAEEEHERIKDELRQAQKLEAVGQLAGGVAHDFNNLLMSIMGYADLSRNELPPDHPVRPWLDEIINEARRSAAIIRQLLTFARKVSVTPEVLDLNKVVADTLNLLRQLIGGSIRLVLTSGENLWPVKIDPSQIDQILVNLCVNARDAISGTGNVLIETANVVTDDAFCAIHPGVVPGSYVRLMVSDDGCGMDQSVCARAFEPFFTTKEIGKGTGLGLATVYGIVKQNGGCIEVASEPGSGTVFKIFLPRYSEPDVEPVSV